MTVSLILTDARRHLRTPFGTALTLCVLTSALLLLHGHYAPHGMCFNDPSWYFHFGHRVIEGKVPYRDFIFQVGPLPIYVDALFQKLFGERYVASLWAATFIKTLRLAAMWEITRQVTSRTNAVLITIFFALEPVISFAHHWSTPYAQLFITLSGLFFIHASRETRRVNLHLFLAGLCAALVVSARQSSAVVVGALLFVSSAILFSRKVFFTTRRFLAQWVGFFTGFLIVFGLLALVGASKAAFQQMFLDAPAKKAIHGIEPLLDGVSGGVLVVPNYDPGFTWWSAVLTYLGIPILVVGLGAFLLARERNVSTGVIAGLLFPIALFVAGLSRYALFNVYTDFPRVLLTLVAVLVVATPKNLERWVGLKCVAALGLGTAGLASDFAMEMSFPGRGWGDPPSLITGALLIILSSSRLTSNFKFIVCAGLAFVGVVHLEVFTRAGLNPVSKDDSSDGTLVENHLESRHPMLRGMKLNASRTRLLEWMQTEVKPGSSCFVYGNLPVLYSLLDCRNPTRIDTTAADFVTAADAMAAMDAIDRQPPDFLIVHARSWMNPDIADDLGNDLNRYGGMNPKASMALHVGLRRQLYRYDVVGEARDVLGPELTKQAAQQRDVMDATRIYKLRKFP